MYDPRHYLLSMCTCPNRVRLREAGKRPDTCLNCGGWCPATPEEAAEAVEREWRRAALWWAVLGLLMTLGAIGMVMTPVLGR